ncbi:YjfB family protein [Halomonas sp.]|uniref:YjfB family protein n=1 Tax=Halomonas sp. TaxID=1486246 RepID=UPI003A0FBBF6
MVDSITSAYTSMNQAQTAQQAGTAVLKQAMNVQEAQGQGPHEAPCKLGLRLHTAGAGRDARPER